jgi:hypothetical protein
MDLIRDFFYEMEIAMADETTTTETVTPPASAAAVETTTEEVFDKERAMATITKLRDAEKEAKKQAKELEQLKADAKKRADAELSEAERLKKSADEAQAEIAKLKTDLMRREVIEESGLPAVFANRLQGATKDEMLADAKELLKAIPAKQAPHVPATNPGGANPNETEATKRERLFGKQGNPFEFDSVKAKGGGVRINFNE